VQERTLGAKFGNTEKKIAKRLKTPSKGEDLSNERGGGLDNGGRGGCQWGLFVITTRIFGFKEKETTTQKGKS